MSKLHEGFVYLDEAVKGVRYDAKYAGHDNLTGSVVDGYNVDRVVVSHEMANGLARAVNIAERKGVGLLVWDSYRPQRAVDCFMRWANAPEDNVAKSKHYPNIERSDIVKLDYISPLSGHTRGAAVDLTLFSLETGELLDMGGYLDLMDEVSHHNAKGIAVEAQDNRRLLRDIMESAGFSAYENEWWHYRIQPEPYPDTYFDFVIE